MKRIDHMSLWERAYFPEIVRGLSVTGYRFWRNLSVHILHAFGFASSRQADVTVQYPEERTPYPETFRGRHRLTLGEGDTANCTACFLCATACPADCIYIEAGEDPENPVEKFALRYEIDTLRCIYCGLCVEACPCDAIRMDTGAHPGNLGFTRKAFVEDEQILTDRSRYRSKARKASTKSTSSNIGKCNVKNSTPRNANRMRRRALPHVARFPPTDFCTGGVRSRPDRNSRQESSTDHEVHSQS